MGESEREGETAIHAMLTEKFTLCFLMAQLEGGLQDIVFQAPSLSASVHTAFIRFLGFGCVR